MACLLWLKAMSVQTCKIMRPNKLRVKLFNLIRAERYWLFVSQHDLAEQLLRTAKSIASLKILKCTYLYNTWRRSCEVHDSSVGGKEYWKIIKEYPKEDLSHKNIIISIQ